MTRPYNILLMSGSMDGGGSERQTLHLLRHLNRELFSPHLFLSYRQGSLLDQVPEDVPITSFWSDSGYQLKPGLPGMAHRRLVQFVRNYLNDAQIDMVYERTFQMSLIAGPSTRGLRVPRIATLVNPPDLDLSNDGGKFIAMKRWLLSRSYRRASSLVTVSDAVADAASKYYGISRNCFTTIHSPVDLAAIHHESTCLPPNINIDPVDVNIACAARLCEQKGQHLLIDAIAALKTHPVFDSLHVWMIGDGPLREQLIAHAKSQDIDHHIHFVGHLESAFGLMSRCQLVCLPSLYEGLPNVLMEAMALGVPVIASDVGGSAELMQGSKFGDLVPSGDASEIANAIIRFVENPESSSEKAALANHHIRTEHSIEAVLPKLERLMLSHLEP